MNLERLHRIAKIRQERKDRQAHADTHRTQADSLIATLQRSRLHASRDGDRLTFTYTAKLRAALYAAIGAIVAALGVEIWWDNNIPFVNTAPAAVFITTLITSGLLVTTLALLAHERTWILSVHVSDPVLARLREHNETLLYLRELPPEPGRGDRIEQEHQRRLNTITQHPQVTLQRAPSLLDRAAKAMRSLRR